MAKRNTQERKDMLAQRRQGQRTRIVGFTPMPAKAKKGKTRTKRALNFRS